MVERFIFVKLEDSHATDAERRALCAAIDALFPTLPGVAAARCGIPADDASLAAWDLYIQVSFAALADVATYRDSPAHRDFVDRQLRPKMAVLKAWNFTAPAATSP